MSVANYYERERKKKDKGHNSPIRLTQQFKGAQSIAEKLSTLPKVQHKINTFDVQPLHNNGIVVFVTGCIGRNIIFF